MANHFSTIGLPVDSEEQYVAIAEYVAEYADDIDADGGRYLQWESNTGAELWLQVDHFDEILAMNPHFTGKSRVRVGITARVLRPDRPPLDGAFHGWADPPDDDPEQGAYPLVFDSPDYAMHARLAIPAIVPVQIAAFAHEVEIFESVEAYDAANSQEPRLASQAFIPAGLFTPDGEDIDPPEANALLSGHIVEAAEMVDDESGCAFFWALVESYGGTFDVVMDPEIVNAAPKPGGVLSGAFWLSGRIVR